jgi:hypothetical protein
MKELELHDQRHLDAAQGWCELHAFLEADAELDNITASLRSHPKVLEVRWQIYANLEKWAGALDIASAIVKLVPDWPSGWIYRASSLSTSRAVRLRPHRTADHRDGRSFSSPCRSEWLHNA